MTHLLDKAEVQIFARRCYIVWQEPYKTSRTLLIKTGCIVKHASRILEKVPGTITLENTSNYTIEVKISIIHVFRRLNL